MMEIYNEFMKFKLSIYKFTNIHIKHKKSQRNWLEPCLSSLLSQRISAFTKPSFLGEIFSKSVWDPCSLWNEITTSYTYFPKSSYFPWSPQVLIYGVFVRSLTNLRHSYLIAGLLFFLNLFLLKLTGSMETC